MATASPAASNVHEEVPVPETDEEERPLVSLPKGLERAREMNTRAFFDFCDRASHDVAGFQETPPKMRMASPTGPMLVRRHHGTATLALRTTGSVPSCGWSLPRQNLELEARSRISVASPSTP